MNNAETIATAIEIMLNSEDPGAIAKIGRIIRTGFFKGGGDKSTAKLLDSKGQRYCSCGSSTDSRSIA